MLEAYGAGILVLRSYKGVHERIASVSTSNARDLRTNLYRIPKTVLYTDLTTLYAPPIWLYTPPSYFYSIFGHPATKARRIGVKSK